ncbi:MAG: protoporphyrinogen oxidase [Myxococcota bacterium]|nr:protoporphyrinogen oxidase [Deltaproteobacteria bacterium]MDP6075828.1 protoporphyrinogen oxidase [Myxococcota bacterium]MDP7075116.1 protoporphyrinogen oxidase [Myxococcota bacterium]MDP7433946.1 protoporphyrinogen oxidase [Myxococcota bacterium]MDP7572314.1 protoporphyrinogen oxidase [Myxococcota bacterium]
MLFTGNFLATVAAGELCMSIPDVDAVVVGSGIAGLAAALELEKHSSEVVLLEASDRPGGVMRTDYVGGFLVERGPNTLQLKAPMLAALREWGLEDALTCALPASRRRYVWRDDELRAVPLSPVGFFTTDLLSLRGKLRLLAEPFVRGREVADESVDEFVRRRLGREALEQLVAPFLTGVYAGDETQLGAEAIFGRLVEYERRFGSIAFGGVAVALARRGERGRSGTWSAPDGLGPFARHLAGRLSEPPAYGARVVALARDDNAWRLGVESAGGFSELRAGRVVLAAPAPVVVELLAGVDPRAAELLAGVRYAPIVGLPLGVPRSALRRPADGFGFLVPRQAGASLLGCLFMSQLFPARAPREHELLQCMLGGARWPEAVDEPDEVLRQHACRDLERVLGLSGEPVDLGVARWPQAIPQPGRDHVGRIAEIRARLSVHPGLGLAGSYLDGVAVADAFASGLRAARELVVPL